MTHLMFMDDLKVYEGEDSGGGLRGIGTNAGTVKGAPWSMWLGGELSREAAFP